MRTSLEHHSQQVVPANFKLLLKFETFNPFRFIWLVSAWANTTHSFSYFYKKNTCFICRGRRDTSVTAT